MIDLNRYKKVGKPDSIYQSVKVKTHIPTPAEIDYKRGYIVRYFVQKANDTESEIYEVDYIGFSKVIDNPFFAKVNLNWRLKGTDDQIKERFKEYFGNYPALWHSDISEKNKRLIWNGIANHKINLVLGARSSLFLPFKKLGLIIIDEEHDQSYKQEDQVIYNARDMAVLMASIKKISVILVSATPSLETYYNTINKKFTYISLDKRYGDAQLPEVKFVNLKKNPPAKSKFISPSIITELKNILEKGNQILFFLNRRGYSTFVICTKYLPAVADNREAIEENLDLPTVYKIIDAASGMKLADATGLLNSIK